LNSATDSVKSRADEVDNQIDVMSKAFFGLTVACARCHDHKFDPIPTADYYALAGVLHSTHLTETGDRFAGSRTTDRRPDSIRDPGGGTDSPPQGRRGV
jgi:cytochrome c553